MIFEPGEWVWFHMRKGRFPAQRHSKLLLRGDGPFNVSDLSPFDVGDDLRTNPS